MRYATILVLLYLGSTCVTATEARHSARVAVATESRLPSGDAAASAQPGHWHDEGRADETDVLDAIILLERTRESESRLSDAYDEATTPGRGGFRQFLTMDQVRSMVDVGPRAHAAVRSWISHSAPTVLQERRMQPAGHGDAFSLTLTSREAEQLFATPFQRYRAQDGRRVLGAKAAPTIPAEVAPAVWAVVGIAPFGPATGRAKALQDHDGADGQASEHGESNPIGPQGDSKLTVISFGGNVVVNFVALCANGSASHVLDPPCSDMGTNITRTELTVTPVQGAAIQTSEVEYFFSTFSTKKHPTQGRAAVATSMTAGNKFSVQLSIHYEDGQSKTAGPFRGYYMRTLSSPATLKAAYGIPPGMSASSVRSGAGGGGIVAVELVQSVDDTDTEHFTQMMGLPNTTVNKFGGDAPVGTEATLDVQVIASQAIGVPQYMYSTPAPKSSVPFAQSFAQMFLTYLLDVGNWRDDISVHSVSFGICESALELKAMERMNQYFRDLGLTGITFVFASGDDGVRTPCFKASGCTSSCNEFCAAYPASSPYVTAVGGTQLFRRGSTPFCHQQRQNGPMGPRQANLAPWITNAGLGPHVSNFCMEEAYVDVVCSQSTGSGITSGGGYSRFFDAPSYQSGISDSYGRSAYAPSKGQWVQYRGNRAVPDLSVSASVYPIVLQLDTRSTTEERYTFFSGGTSAAAPLFASMLALINDRATAVGLPRLGPVNAWLYHVASAYPEAFRDVVSGNNRCSRSSHPACCEEGFAAAPGWDAATGLGAPLFDRLMAVALAERDNSYVGFAGAGVHEQPGPDNHKGNDGPLVLAIVSIVTACIAAGVAILALRAARLPQRSDRELPLLQS